MYQNYVWIYHGEEKTVPENFISIIQAANRNVVCLCPKSLLEEIQEEYLKIGFEEILFDERYVENGLIVAREVLRAVGGVNLRLTEKQDYELALRIAENSEEKLLVLGWSEIEGIQEAKDLEKGFQTDAYIVGRYYPLLQQMGIAEIVLQSVIEECQFCEEPKKAQAFLEKMVSHSAEYQQLYRATQPILIYLGVTYCYNILNVFAKELGKALEAAGERVEYYDTEKDDVRELSKLISNQYKASIGFQTWIMSAKMGTDRTYVQDLIGGPKYNFVVDHPGWLRDQLEQVPEQFSVLTHDRDYKSFIEKYFKNVKHTYLLPPGGRVETSGIQAQKEKKDIVFLGTYMDYREKLAEIRKWHPRMRHFAARYLKIMKQSPDLSAEEALYRAMEFYKMKLSDNEILELFYDMMSVIQTVMFYYREKVISTVLKAGFDIYVYGKSWWNSPFCEALNLIIEPEVAGEQGLEVLSTAKISLNVMAWHKDGFTERIADSMLSGAVVVSDRSRQLTEKYSDEIVQYDLTQLSELPVILEQLLGSEEKRSTIAQKAKQRALESETWNMRAKELLRIIEKDDGRKS